MARDLNKVMLIGRLGRDPEMRFTPSGQPVTTFRLATGRSWTTNKGEKKSETEWFNIVAWGGLAEVCNQFLEKGMRVYIEGRLQTRRWEDSSGNKKSKAEVVANEMIMLSPRSRQGANPDYEQENQFEEDYEDEEDDFPF